MKKYCIALVALTASLAFAGVNDEAIQKLEAEIARREAVISQLKAEGKPTGRFEMTVLRLRNELQKLKDLNG